MSKDELEIEREKTRRLKINVLIFIVAILFAIFALAGGFSNTIFGNTSKKRAMNELQQKIWSTDLYNPAIIGSARIYFRFYITGSQSKLISHEAYVDYSGYIFGDKNYDLNTEVGQIVVDLKKVNTPARVQRDLFYESENYSEYIYSVTITCRVQRCITANTENTKRRVSNNSAFNRYKSVSRAANANIESYTKTTAGNAQAKSRNQQTWWFSTEEEALDFAGQLNILIK